MVALVLVLAICLPVSFGASNTQWTLVQSAHVKVYSQAGEHDGRSALLWFEQLRALFSETIIPLSGINLEPHGPVRVIGFQSTAEYEPFRLKPAADAYFIGGEAADYIVMPSLHSEDLGVAAHEYAHLVLHSLGLHLPPWLSEGIAEFFSSVRISEKGGLIGGDLPARTFTLRRKQWIPLGQLLSLPADSSRLSDRNAADLFYSESWALTQMLIRSPEYAPRFSQLMQASDPLNLTRIYGKSFSEMTADLHGWVQGRRPGVPIPGIPSINMSVQVSELNNYESRLMIADMLLACGDLARAKATYKALANERPDDATVHAALGTVALKQDDRTTACEQWARAMQLGIRDAALCYQYAILAEDAGLPSPDIGEALRRAIELKPNFDDARYKLGLLESNSGHYEAALEQFRAMRFVAPERAYTYWTAVSSALTETDQRDDAKAAANQAMRYAKSPEERTRASQLAYVAATDLTVQVSRDTNGNLKMITARKPHGSDDWNPFIEPGDHIVSVEGQIRNVECSSGRLTGFRVATSSNVIEVAVPEPSHVLIRGGTPEFTCGAEDQRKVQIQYATLQHRTPTDGILRGLQFR
jgi:tetratricopeptide (TPR) repeat protein